MTNNFDSFVLQFSTSDFPMDHEHLVSKVYDYCESLNMNERIIDSFFEDVEKYLHAKFKLVLVGDLAAGDGKHVFKD